MSNRQKDELDNDNFGIRSFQGCHGEILSRDRYMPKVPVCPEFLIQQPGQVLTVITHKSLTVSSRKMDHQKAERVADWNCIWNFRSFGLA
jgi:hypothetical protein